MLFPLFLSYYYFFYVNTDYLSISYWIRLVCITYSFSTLEHFSVMMLFQLFIDVFLLFFLLFFFPTHFPWNCTFIGTFLCKVDAYHMAIQTIQVLDAWSLAGHCSSQCVLISPLPWRFSRSRVRHVVHKIVWSLLEESPWLGLYRAS